MARDTELMCRSGKPTSDFASYSFSKQTISIQTPFEAFESEHIC